MRKVVCIFVLSNTGCSSARCVRPTVEQARRPRPSPSIVVRLGQGLHRVGNRAHGGANAMAALNMVAREHPDLVLVDVHLAGGSDGLAAAKEIQERFEVPAMAATGHLTAAEAESAGLLGILSKPSPYALRAVLEGQQHGWRAT
jgi:CheY-like chemotaxis protein